MRIVRFSDGDSPKFGLLKDDSNRVFVLRGDPMFSPIEPSGEVFELDEIRLLAPVIPRSKVVAAARNWPTHAPENTPDEPVIFIKPNTSVTGPEDPIIYPAWSNHIEPEGELAVVVKTLAKDVPVDRVDDIVFGYTVGNDVSARDKQRKDGQFTRGKGFDSSCPLGPWITVDPELDIDSLQITTRVDGTPIQQGNTADMIFPVRELVSFVSRCFTLLPGDVILTGTPTDSVPVHPGDRVEVEIEGIGKISNPVIRR